MSAAERTGERVASDAPDPGPTSLREMLLLFLRLGTTAFGGPAPTSR